MLYDSIEYRILNVEVRCKLEHVVVRIPFFCVYTDTDTCIYIYVCVCERMCVCVCVCV